MANVQKLPEQKSLAAKHNCYENLQFPRLLSSKWTFTTTYILGSVICLNSVFIVLFNFFIQTFLYRIFIQQTYLYGLFIIIFIYILFYAGLFYNGLFYNLIPNTCGPLPNTCGQYTVSNLIGAQINQTQPNHPII